MLGGTLQPRPPSTTPLLDGISSSDGGSSMPPRNRAQISKDEELGKRDDDFKPRLSRSSSIPSVLPWNWRKRRIAGLLLLVSLLYTLLVYIPSHYTLHLGTEDLDARYDAVAQSEPSGAPPTSAGNDADETPAQNYNGHIRFYKLARSLNRIRRTIPGGTMMNMNVLFVASSTKCAANLIPMACEMAKVDRNHVHFAMFGRSTISLDDIMMYNGVDESDCPVFFHDARSDFPEYSSDARIEAAVIGAMKHINEFMHPQAIIMDDEVLEDVPFRIAMRAKAKALDRALIEVPYGRYEDWLWITRLDALSLANWHKLNVEILIHAPMGSSGGLLRLLKSLYNADYNGLKVPRLTIELPSDVEHFLGKYLGGFKWPPGRDHSQQDTLTLRHRIPKTRLNSVQASTRFVESFYPSEVGNSHVLVLSPHVELSPVYLQYLHFTILEYHAQTFGWYQAKDVLGIALDVPRTLVDGNTTLKLPSIANATFNRYASKKADNEDDPSPFLYQGLFSTASLIFSEQWLTFHDFLGRRVQASRDGQKSRRKKVVAETEPAWVEFLLELMRARGWTMLYPSLSFATVHNDLAQIPEEFAWARGKEKNEKPDEKAEAMSNEPFILSAEAPMRSEHLEADPSRHHMPLHEMLPFKGELQPISNLPVLAYDGESTDTFALSDEAEKYATWFRSHVGGCTADEAEHESAEKQYKTDDLFCDPGMNLQSEYTGDDSSYWAAHIAEAIVESTEDDLQSSDSQDAADALGKSAKLSSTIETLDRSTGARQQEEGP